MVNATVPLKQQVWFDDFQATPKTGQVRIQRDSDKLYFNGTGWQSNAVWLATTVDVTAKEHWLDFLPDASMFADRLVVTMRINNDPITEHTENINLGLTVATAGLRY